MNRRNESYTPLLCNYPDSEKINKVSEGAEAMFCRLLAKCDDEGNYHGSPKRLLGKLFTLRYENGTMTASKVSRYCNELVTATLITRYVVDTVTYIHINNCKKCLRKDITPKVFFPAYDKSLEVVTDTGLNESVTGRNGNVTGRNGDVTPIQSNPIQSNPNTVRFDRFYKPYPRKTNKQAAVKAFYKLNPDDLLLETIIAAIEQQKLSDQWRRGIIPHPSTWLNGHRWTDVMPQVETDSVAGKIKLFPIKGRICQIKNCGMPAVYKKQGEYDHYYCLDHSPEKIKEKYY